MEAVGLIGRTICLLVLSTAYSVNVIADDCKLGKYDISDLQTFSPWFVRNDVINATFEISLCNKLTQDPTVGARNCPHGTAVCARFDNGTSFSYGQYSTDPNIEETEKGQNGDLMLMLTGELCTENEHGSDYASFFYFKCGKTLGYPRHLGDFPCYTHFEWESYVFCQDLPVPDKEVPCTVMTNDDLHEIDLSPLTKLKGAYLVDADETHHSRIYINVCREIRAGTSAGDGMGKCPKGSGSCQVVGDEVKNFGEPSQKLEATKDGARLTYTAPEKPDGCEANPTTVINFRCPERGGSKDPVLLAVLPCSFEIDWVTEYACPVDTIVSDTCKLTMAQHNVDIDLTPLKRQQFNPYVVNVTDGSDHYMYFINICDTLGTSCGKAIEGLASVCQRKGDGDFSKSAGENRFTSLRYSDNQLSMTMRNGDACHTNFRRATTIDFFCNKTAVNEGKGYPEFVAHKNCSYFFVWGTKYACVEAKLDQTCAVNEDGRRYDLSSLVREKGDNWEVIKGENQGQELTYFLNVCHDVLKTGGASGCPQGGAVCSADKSGAKSLGSYKQTLSYNKDSQSLRLVYNDGEKTGTDCSRNTIVNFFCSPGNVESAPRLVHQSRDNCYYEIEWHTSAACPLSRKTGTDCKVYDDDAGYTFDLNPLKKDEGYEITGSDGYKYIINVCAELKHKTFCQSKPHNNAAICQVNAAGNNEEKKVASPSTTLTYFDGVLNLTYTNGEPYNDPDHTARQAEIAFICDMSVDVGLPEFLEERQYTYAFEWRTRHACPTLPVECAITDKTTFKQYDLSSLTKATENWQIENRQDPDNIKKFYINICRPVVPVQNPTFSCSAFASVCATNVDKTGKETLFHGNLGRSETAPELEKSITGVKLTYTNGDICHDTDGTVKNFKTSIHFDCVPGKVAGGPNSPRLINPCEYAILWETEAACAVDSVIQYDANVTDCSIQDPNSDFMFNLKPLAKKGGYNITASSKSYKINICDTLPDDVCGKLDDKYSSSVCEISEDGKAPKAMILGSKLEYISEGEITLTYKGKLNIASGAQESYVFNMFCDRGAQSPVITFDSHTFMSTVFKVRTALACPPQPVSCVIQGQEGKLFDLTPLAREKGNWVVIDTRESHSDLRYHINVCRPVNTKDGVTCPGGAVGGCQTSLSGSMNFNMGYVQSEPVLSNVADAITLHYEGGDKCHVGKETEAYRSTRIIFFCDTAEHGPVFESESETCEYIFFWKTPSACPQQIVTGSQCKVTEPLYNFEFDLSPLTKASSHYTVAGAGYSFLLNVCGSLNGAPEPCSDSYTGACQTGADLSSPIVTGHYNDQPQYNSGVISLIYTGGKDKCHGKFERTTVIDFVCHHDQSGQDGPKYLDEKTDCTYTFEWPTRAACPPHQVTDCALQDGDQIFDLSPLSRSDGNYERADNASNEIFILNICRSLVHKKDQTCPENAAACRIDLSERDPKKRYHNLGEVTSHSLTYQRESETLVLRYDNGEVCPGTKKHRSTVILFTCDESSDALGSPGGHFVLNDCEDHFVWTSSAACPLVTETEEKKTEKGFGDCRVTNPNTGYEFDLSSLRKDEGYKTYDRHGHEFHLNICGWLDSSSKCNNGTGACQVSMIGDKKSVSAGEANARLTYNDGVLGLEYSDGEICSKTKVPRITYINFVCQPGEGNGVPVFIDSSDDCLFYFDWHTQLACEKEVECSVDTPSGYTLDFSPLIKKSGKYNVIPSRTAGHQPSSLIYVNLCRPLNPIYGTICPSGSAACLINDDDKPLSLGRIDEGPVYDKVHQETKITYSNGDPCPSNPSVKMSSVIILTCGTDDYSEPTEEGLSSDCQYVFLWETPLACEGKRTQKLFQNCSYFDYSTQRAYDLSSLSDPYEVKSSHGGHFQLQPCGGLKEKGEKGQASCAGSAVCMQGSKGTRDGSFGVVSHGMFQKGSSYLQLTFSQGRQCANGKHRAMSTIYFYCDRSAGKGMPEIFDDENDCEVTFRWLTSLVCPPQKEECLISKSGSLFDFSFLSQDDGSWNYTDTEKNTYWMNLCQPVHGMALSSGCPPGAAVCRKSPDGEVKMLGRLNSQQVTAEGERALETKIVVQYSEGDPDVCGSNRRRRSETAPKVIITLTCGLTVGAPVLQSSTKDDCVFNFAWKSKLACPVGTDTLPLKVKSGVVYDERTGNNVDLNPILARRDNMEISEEKRKYLINIGKQVTLDRNIPESASCRMASVCLIIPTSNTYKNIGTFSTGSFYMEDDRLEVVFTSPELCAGNKKKTNITSIITFTCKEGESKAVPRLLYKSSECVYVFNWDTDVVCQKAVPSLIKPGTGYDGGSHGKSISGKASPSHNSNTKIIAGVSVAMALVVACVLALLLHNPQRRTAIGSRIKKIILCRKTQDAPIVYSRLSQADADLDDPFNPFNEPDEESEINTNSLPLQTQSFHDDSDEDMLL